jgi:hypothetical protein
MIYRIAKKYESFYGTINVSLKSVGHDQFCCIVVIIVDKTWVLTKGRRTVFSYLKGWFSERIVVQK